MIMICTDEQFHAAIGVLELDIINKCLHVAIEVLASIKLQIEYFKSHELDIMADSPTKKLKVKSFYGSRSLDKSTRTNKWGIWPNPISSKDSSNKTQSKGMKRKVSSDSQISKSKKKTITYESYSKFKKKAVEKQKLDVCSQNMSESTTSETDSSILMTSDTESDGLYPPIIKKKIRNFVESTPDTLQDISGSLEVSLSSVNDSQLTKETPKTPEKARTLYSNSSDCQRTPDDTPKVLSYPSSPSLKYISSSSIPIISPKSKFQNPFAMSKFSQTSFSTVSDRETMISSPSVSSISTSQISPCSSQRLSSTSISQSSSATKSKEKEIVLYHDSASQQATNQHKKSSVESIWDDFESAFDKDPDTCSEKSTSCRGKLSFPSTLSNFYGDEVAVTSSQSQLVTPVVSNIENDKSPGVADLPQTKLVTDNKQKTLFDYFKRCPPSPESLGQKECGDKGSDDLKISNPPKPTRLKLSYQAKLDGNLDPTSVSP